MKYHHKRARRDNMRKHALGNNSANQRQTKNGERKDTPPMSHLDSGVTDAPKLRRSRSSNQPDPIIYDRRPANAHERLMRRREQRRYAFDQGKDWDALPPLLKRKKIWFGTEAKCRNPTDVRDLVKLTARMGHERELRSRLIANLTPARERKLKALIGFTPPGKLYASNRFLRSKLSASLARRMRRIYRKSAQKFCIITIGNSRWSTNQWNTEVNIREIKEQVQQALDGLNMNWLAMVEFDIFNNVRGLYAGQLITPHVHILGWGDTLLPP